MGNLYPKPGNGNRPFTKGKAIGKKNGSDVEVEKEYGIDSGREISSITAENARHFDLTDTGNKTSWGSKLYSGMTMKFKVRNPQGVDEEVECDLPFTVETADLLAADQLAKVHAKLHWNSKEKKGNLYSGETAPDDDDKKTGGGGGW